MGNRSYIGEPMTQALLARQRAKASEHHHSAVKQVNRLLDTQRELGQELGNGLSALSEHGSELSDLKAEEEGGGLLASLMRPFTANRRALARKSIAEGLLEQYEHVSVKLREATSFSDDLKLCALEMQQEVDRLHRQLGESLNNQRVAAERILEIEASLDGLQSDADLSEEAKHRLRDRYTFDLRTETVHLELQRASAQECRQHLEPARSLRDTVLQLHEDMARYVLHATHQVNAAGRRIQGVGMLADAPTVVTELQESLDQLNEAMSATADYVEQSQALISEVLPELAARVAAENEERQAELHSDLSTIDREKAHREAQRTLREAAEAEIEAFLGPG